MMMIGHDGGSGSHPRHDGITYCDPDGEVTRVHLNGVAVTQLPLLDGKDTRGSIASTASNAFRQMKPLTMKSLTLPGFGMLRVPLKTPFKTALRTVDRSTIIIAPPCPRQRPCRYGEAPVTP